MKFDYWIKRSPKFVLEQSAWCARIIREWIEAYGKEKAGEMILESPWVDPADTLFATAWEDGRAREDVR